MGIRDEYQVFRDLLLLGLALFQPGAGLFGVLDEFFESLRGPLRLVQPRSVEETQLLVQFFQ